MSGPGTYKFIFYRICLLQVCKRKRTLDIGCIDPFSRIFSSVCKQWINLKKQFSEKCSGSQHVKSCSQFKFHLPSSKSYMKVTKNVVCIPGLFYVLACTVLLFIITRIKTDSRVMLHISRKCGICTSHLNQTPLLVSKTSRLLWEHHLSTEDAAFVNGWVCSR